MMTLRSFLLFALFLSTVLATTTASEGRHLRRRLNKNEEQELLKQAKEACQYVKKGDRQLCIDDVMTTGDVEMAEMWPKSLPQKYD
mgnify:CR=1 FL=1